MEDSDEHRRSAFGAESLDKKNRSYPRFKAGLRRLLLGLGGIRRIHIVGAARSGTTMLHYAMIAFQGVRLFDSETDVRWTPSLKDSVRMCVQGISVENPQILVTKRSFGWFRTTAIGWLVEHAASDGVGVIHIVRDPRDSLTSRHLGKDDQEFYLDVDRWVQSVQAAEDLIKRLDGRAVNITIRYEDVLTKPLETQELVARTFDLHLRDGIQTWATLGDNLESAGTAANMALAMHGVRDFDAASVGRGRLDSAKIAYFSSLLEDPRYSECLSRFMKKYGYEVAG